MLSADVPEFVPRGYPSPGSTNTANFNPEERISQPQQGRATSCAYTPPFSLRSGPTVVPKSSSPQGEREKGESSLFIDSQKQNCVWRESRKEYSSHGEGQTHEANRHETGTATFPKNYSVTPKKMPEKQVSQKGKSRPKAMSTEDLEFHMRNKFVTAPNNLTFSYTRILKNNNPKNRVPELKSNKPEDFSLSTDSHWPSLGESRPLYISNQSKDTGKRENISIPWVCGSNEASPTKSFMNNPENPWQEKSAGKQTNTSVKPRSTKENHITSENYVETKPAPQNLRNARTDPSLNDSKRLGSKKKQEPKNQSEEGGDKPMRQTSNSSSALNTEEKSCHKLHNQEEAAPVTINTTILEDSDLFQWKVIGEKKKKVKIKKQEVRDSSRFQELLRGDGKKYGRVLPDKPSLGLSMKQNQEYPCKNIRKFVVDMSKSKSVHSTSSQERQGENKKDPPAPKAGLKEGKKLRPTKVMSLANCSNDKWETRSNLKRSTTMAAPKPVDEETLHKRLTAKLIKQEEKRKIKEMKAQQALIRNRPKDTKVSLITTDFLEKTQTHHQISMHQMSRQINSSHERTTLTSEEYPALQTFRNTTPNLHSNKNTQELTLTHRPNKITREMPPTPVKIKAGDVVLSHNKANTCTSDKADIAFEEQATTYRTALLAAKEKDITQETSNTELSDNTPIDTTQKKKVRTTDLIELDLLALAAQGGKKKKKELLADKFSPTKRKLYDEDEERYPASKTSLAVHSVLPKGAAVVAKRGKISTKPKKKKISRIKRCQMEKKQMEMLALQLLLQQAKRRAEQQKSLETPPSPHFEAEKSSDEADVGKCKNLNEPLNSITKTETDKYRDKSGLDIDYDKVKQEKKQEKSECLTGHNVKNKENTRTSETPYSPLNTNSQTIKKPAENETKETKLIWVLKSTESAVVQKETQVPPQTIKSGKKDDSTKEEKTNSQQSKEKDSPRSPSSPTYEELLEDPQIVERASELITLVKSQKLSPKGPREYVHQVVTPEVNTLAKELMKNLIAFQERHFQRDPTKARIRKRYVCGLKETTKLMGKMSCVIMAPNIQQCEGPGSLDDAVEKLLNQAEQHKVPVVFALSIRIMRNLCRKHNKRVSCFGIISYQGAQDLFHRLMQLLPEAQKQYQQLVASGQCTLPKEGDEEEGEKGKPVSNNMTEEIIAHTNTLLISP